MMRRILFPALAASLVFTAVACEPKLPATIKSAGTPVAADSPTTPAEIGGDLYPPAPIPPRTASAATAPIDPIVVRNCLLTAPETQNVPSKNNGALLVYCTDIPEGVTVKESDVWVHPVTGKRYSKLDVGIFVKPGQLIGLLDDKVARADKNVAEANLQANIAKKNASIELHKYYVTDYKRNYDSMLKLVTPKAEVDRSEAQMKKAEADIAEAEGGVLKAQEELKKAEVVLSEHEIRSSISGRIQRLYRRKGESIKALDPVVEVQNLDELRVEGMLEVKYLALQSKIQQGQKTIQAIVERAEPTAEEQQLPGNLMPVRAVSVSKDAKKPLIVSAGEDKTVHVWERLTGRNVANWRHPVAVRAVACSPPGSADNLCLTGADDGQPRLWDLDNLASTKPIRELKIRHLSQIVCAAFAPNGQFCATADSGEIMIWDVATGDLKYKIGNAHKGPITYVQFTPQARLVSASRDRTIRVWKLGEKGAALETQIEHRFGNLLVTGVSPNGQDVLFDQEKALHILNLFDQRNEGVILAPTDASQFATFALFSPDGKLVLAAGTGDSPLQLCRAPAGAGRGSIVRNLAIAAGSVPTCAAFSPDGTFAVTGTQDHKVLVWGMPERKEIDRQLTATISFIGLNTDPAQRKVPIFAKINNPDGVRLLPGETVTLVIPPQEAR